MRNDASKEITAINLELDGAVVLITGGSKGIGLASAKAFLVEGAKVAIVSRERANLQSAAAELGVVATIAADLKDPEAAARAVGEVKSKLGPLDILVNAAGAAKRTPPDELTPAAWRDAMDAKYFTYINAIDAALSRMAARRKGVIVNVIGAGGKVASPTHLPGGAANAALMLATAGLGNAYARSGIRVVGVNPGLTETERLTEGFCATARFAGVSLDEARRRGAESTALGRFARPEEIANVIVFLASARASHVTGVTLGLDGATQPIMV